MRIEVLGGLERRRRWSQDDKARIVEETLAPGAKVTEVASQRSSAQPGVYLASTSTDIGTSCTIFYAGADRRRSGLG
ncbi:transposase [Bradyrhizobium sp. 138]|nr:transposase [Bradyrhizobium sp. 138]